MVFVGGCWLLLVVVVVVVVVAAVVVAVVVVGVSCDRLLLSPSDRFSLFSVMCKPCC